MYSFWWHDQDCVWIAAELCEKFNTRVLLNIYFRIPLPLSSYRENDQFYDTPPFYFFMEKYLLKEVADFRLHEQDCV